MSKTGMAIVHTTLVDEQGAHAGDQGTMFGEGGLEKETHMEKEKKVWTKRRMRLSGLQVFEYLSSLLFFICIIP